MFRLADHEEYCDFCVKIVNKPHTCEVAARLSAKADQREEEMRAAGISYAPGVIWNCGGGTRGYYGGPGTGLPKVETASNPGHNEPTLASLGLTAEHGKKLGIC